ncbi:MAG: hypothetical protein KME45_30960 [Stenomitos rutilans HA7619-LM2]|jgi:WD40 repeat protein/energy-coupling factor transporter ATP-binding protein EcfA2|nr:hypothetical protein [Stenomitos rutilans HA7619-LM2]
MLTPEEFNVILERVSNGTASADDLDRLRRSQSKTGGPVNINIDELTGEDVHIGDRITIEQILGQKIIYLSVDEIKTRKLIQSSPYKGLKKFEPEDKDRFFGRDQFIKELANELEQTNLVLLLGASGSGKSSVVRAGLLSWLSKKWVSRLVSLTFTPDQDPFESLYASLKRYYKAAEAQVARDGKEDTLTQVVTTLRRSDAYWFIFIDQFEELFTTSQADKRDGSGATTKGERFIASLVQLNTALKFMGTAKDCPVKVVATMRADFFDRLSPYPAFVKATDKHRPFIAEMQSDELRQAIEQPAAQHGVVFETGLVEEIIKDVQWQAGYLPLLQYTLNLVWETEVQNGSIHDRTLNISTYRGLGGVRGALQKHVSQIYEALPEAERLAAQRVFLKLVEIGGDEESGTEWKPVRRRAMRSEFDTELERRVLVRLIDENLLVSDQQPQVQASTVEIAHEALLTSWEMLNTWIKENRQAIALRNRLNDDVARWQAKKAEDELWTGSKLEQVLELKKNPTFNQVMGGFSTTANQFIDTSLGLRDRIRERQIRQARRITVGAVVAIGLIGIAGIFSFLQQVKSQKQSVITAAEASKANFLAGRQLEAILNAVKAGKQFNLLLFGRDEAYAPTVSALTKVFYETKEINRLESLSSWKLSFNRKILAFSKENGSAYIWDTTSKEFIQLSGQQEIIEFSPDNNLLATHSKDNTVHLWDITGKEIDQLGQQEKIVFFPNSKLILTYNKDNTVQLWDTTGRKIAQLGQQEIVEFSPDSNLLVSREKDNTVQLWDTTGRKIAQLGQQEIVEFSPDSNLLVSREKDNTVQLWDTTGRKIAQLGQQQEIKFYPNDELLVTRGKNNVVQLWNFSGRKVIRLSGEHSSIELSPDSKLLATCEKNNIVDLWDKQGKKVLQYSAECDDSNMMFNPTGKLLAITRKGAVVLLDLSDSRAVSIEASSASDHVKVTFSPDGNQLVTEVTGHASVGDYAEWSASQSIIRLWDVQGREISQFQGENGSAEFNVVSFDDKQLITSGSKSLSFWNLNNQENLAFWKYREDFKTIELSSDGTLLIIYKKDGSIELWNITGKLLVQFRGFSGYINDVKYSPDSTLLSVEITDNNKTSWHIINSKGEEIFLHGSKTIRELQFSPKGDLLATSEDDGSVKLWNNQGEKISQFQETSKYVTKMKFSPANTLLAVETYDGHTESSWHVINNKGQEVFLHGSKTIRELQFSPKGDLLATSEDDGSVKLWNNQGEKISQFRGTLRDDCIFSPDGQILVTDEKDGLYIWEVSGKKIAFIQSNEQRIYTLQFSPNSRLLVAGGENGLNLWDTKGQKIATLQERIDGISVIRFSPQSNRFITYDIPRGCDQCGLILANASVATLWDATGKEMMKLKGHQGGITQVEFSPDGQLIATLGLDESVKLWDINGKEIVPFEGTKRAAFSGSSRLDLRFSSDSKLLSVGKRLWKLFELNELLVQNCDRVKAYLRNPSASLSHDDRNLCDGIGLGK